MPVPRMVIEKQVVPVGIGVGPRLLLAKCNAKAYNAGMAKDFL